MTVNKTVLTLSFPLHNTGPAGLGISVHSRSTGGKNGEEMGVYIQSIVPGGAAAMVKCSQRRGGGKLLVVCILCWPVLDFKDGSLCA